MGFQEDKNDRFMHERFGFPSVTPPQTMGEFAGKMIADQQRGDQGSRGGLGLFILELAQGGTIAKGFLLFVVGLALSIGGLQIPSAWGVIGAAVASFVALGGVAMMAFGIVRKVWRALRRR